MTTVIRLMVINMALWGHLIRWALAHVGLRRSRLSPASCFAATLDRLGTTFVKLGQGLSLHRELLPDDYVLALQKLHDHVEPFGIEAAQAEIEASFGKPVRELFASFGAQALAAGSIAQVHAATMPDGRNVIVKVRRPGIRRQIREDIRILRWFIASVLWVMPWLRSMRPLELIDELARNLEREIDFRQEAASIDRFARMFEASTTVYIPGVVDGMYTEWVIVQEMSPGERIDARRFAADGSVLAAHLVDAYLRQLIVEGVFHGDPHPGNLFVLADGRICFHDFGLVGHLDRETRVSLVAMMLAFVRQDGDWMLDACLDLGLIARVTHRAALRAGIEDVMQDYARKPLRDWSFGEVLLRVSRLGDARNARLPQHLLILLRAIFLLESTVRRLDPAFSLVDGLFVKAGAALAALTSSATQRGEQGAAAVAVDRLRFETMRSAQQLSGQLGAALRRLRADGLQFAVAHRGIEPLADAMLSVGRWVAQALLALGLFIGASVLLQAKVGPHWREVPLLAFIGYALAAWLTWRLLRSMRPRGER